MKGTRSRESARSQPERGGFAGKRVWTPAEDTRLHQALEDVAPGTYQRWALVSQRVRVSAKACRNRAAFLGKRHQPTQQNRGERGCTHAIRPVQDHSRTVSDDEESEYDEIDERMDNMGFTVSELNDIISYGVKPWDPDAWDFLRALKEEREQIDAANSPPEEECHEESEEDELDERMEHMGFTTAEFNLLLSYGVKPWDSNAWEFLHDLQAEFEQIDAANSPREEECHEESEDDEVDERMEHMGFTAAEFNLLLSYGVKPWDSNAWEFLAELGRHNH